MSGCPDVTDEITGYTLTLRFIEASISVGMCAERDAQPLHLWDQVVSIGERGQSVERHVLTLQESIKRIML